MFLSSVTAKTNVSKPNWIFCFLCLTLWTEAPFHSLQSEFSGVLWWWAGKRKDSSQLSLWNLNSTPNSPVAPVGLSCQISPNQRKAEMSANVNKHWKTRAKGNDITNVISVSISNRLFQCRYSNSRDVVASSPSFSCPTARSPRRGCSPATFFMISSCVQKVASTDNCPFPSRNADKWSFVRVQFRQTTLSWNSNTRLQL